MSDSEMLQRLSERVCVSAEYLGYAVSLLAPQALMAFLGIDSMGLVRLRLCRQPVDIEGINKVAVYVGCDAGKLREVVEMWRDAKGRIVPGQLRGLPAHRWYVKRRD